MSKNENSFGSILDDLFFEDEEKPITKMQKLEEDRVVDAKDNENLKEDPVKKTNTRKKNTEKVDKKKDPQLKQPRKKKEPSDKQNKKNECSRSAKTEERLEFDSYMIKSYDNLARVFSEMNIGIDIWNENSNIGKSSNFAKSQVIEQLKKMHLTSEKNLNTRQKIDSKGMPRHEFYDSDMPDKSEPFNLDFFDYTEATLLTVPVQIKHEVMQILKGKHIVIQQEKQNKNHYEKGSIPEMEKIDRNYAESFMRQPRGIAFGERPCSKHENCLSMKIKNTIQKEGNSFIVREFLLPSQLETYKKTGVLPQEQQLCILDNWANVLYRYYSLMMTSRTSGSSKENKIKLKDIGLECPIESTKTPWVIIHNHIVELSTGPLEENANSYDISECLIPTCDQTFLGIVGPVKILDVSRLIQTEVKLQIDMKGTIGKVLSWSECPKNFH